MRPPWFTDGWTFVYEFINDKKKKKKLKHKLEDVSLMLAPGVDLGYRWHFSSDVIGGSSGGSAWELTPARLDNASHFFNHATGGIIEPDAAQSPFFPRKPFAQLVKKGSTTWRTGWGEGKKVKLERFAAKPYKVKLGGKPESLPAVGARGGGLTLLLLDDPEFPLVLELSEKPYGDKLIEILPPSKAALKRAAKAAT